MNKKRAFAAIPLAVLVVFALALAGCGSTSSPTSKTSGGASASPMSTASGSSSPTSSGNTIRVTSSGFPQHTITVQASQPVVFDDVAGTHTVCVSTGTGGTTCATASQAPTAPLQLVDAGTVLGPGQKVSFTFKPGTYQIISPNQPGMYITVIVK